MVAKLKKAGFDPAAVALMAELDELVNELNALDSPGRSVMKLEPGIVYPGLWENPQPPFWEIDRQVALNKWVVEDHTVNGTFKLISCGV